MKKVALLLIFPLLTACSGMRGGITKSELESGKNIAVVSVLGDTFHGIHIGTTVFGNVTYDAAVPEWNIDGMTEQFILRYLTQSKSLNVTIIQHNPDLNKRLEDSWSFMHNGYNYDEVISLAKAQGADILIIVQPVTDERIPLVKAGYGFYERTFWGTSHRSTYTLCAVIAFSTHTGKRLAWEWGQVSVPLTELEWKDAFDKYSPKEVELLHGNIETRIKHGVEHALGVLGY